MISLGSSHGRLTRDAAELFTTDFTCSASHVQVSQTTDSLNDAGSITLEISVFEGPYRGGLFHFCFQIPANYPFRPLEIWAVQPIWHPNVDMKTGKMQIPLDWSPVLTLKSFAIAVQMLMIQPSVEGPLNMEAYSLFLNNPAQFDAQTQLTLRGGWFSEVYLPCAMLPVFSVGRAQTDHTRMETSPVLSEKTSLMQSPAFSRYSAGTSTAAAPTQTTPSSHRMCTSVFQLESGELLGSKMKRPFGAMTPDDYGSNHKKFAVDENNVRIRSRKGDFDSDDDNMDTDDMNDDEETFDSDRLPTPQGSSADDLSLLQQVPQHQQLSQLSLQSSGEFANNNRYLNNAYQSPRKRTRKF